MLDMVEHEIPLAREQEMTKSLAMITSNCFYVLVPQAVGIEFLRRNAVDFLDTKDVDLFEATGMCQGLNVLPSETMNTKAPKSPKPPVLLMTVISSISIGL